MNSPQSEIRLAFLALEDALSIDDKAAASIQLNRLVELGSRQSFAAVADLYEYGNVRLKPRLDLAFEWYSKSAYEEVDREGYFALARFYFEGKHVERDFGKAACLFREAFGLGSMEAGIMLGYSYLLGYGVDKDLDKAEKYFSVAAESGYAVGFHFLARVAYARKHYLSALSAWWRCVSLARRLTMQNPSDRKLYFLHGAWKP